MKIERKAIVVVLALLLMLETCALAPRVGASSLVGFPSLVPYDFNDQASSFKVIGKVILYGDVDYGNGSIIFADTSIPDLRDNGWNDRASSLEVDGTVTLYWDISYGGKRISFTSNVVPYDDLGKEWNLNPSLLKSEDRWDPRVWYWNPWVLHSPAPDSDNYMNWTSDGLVKGDSNGTAGGLYYYKAEDFAQGFERTWNAIPRLDIYTLVPFVTGWNDVASSLKVDGAVTLFENRIQTSHKKFPTIIIQHNDGHKWRFYGK